MYWWPGIVEQKFQISGCIERIGCVEMAHVRVPVFMLTLKADDLPACSVAVRPILRLSGHSRCFQNPSAFRTSTTLRAPLVSDPLSSESKSMRY